MRVHSDMSMDGTGMHTSSLHVCVDGRYAINHYPGIGRVTSMLCQAWAMHPQIHRLDILTNPHSPQDLFHIRDTHSHVHLHYLDAPPFGIAEWWQMRKLLANLSPDWLYAPYFLMPPSHKPTKRMLTVHDAIPLELTSMSLSRRIALTQMVRFSMNHVDCVTSVSTYAAQQIRHHYRYHGNIAVIPNGVADIFFDTPSTHQLAEYGITQPFGLCVSSNQPHKNLDGLLAAWALAYRAGQIPTHSQLILAGHTDTRRDMPWLHPQYADIPVVHVSDPDDTLLNQLYHAAHLFILPSLAEGFGLPILEALAAERVVLCHDYPTLRQLHGDVVYYTDMRHAKQVARDIHVLWHNHQVRERLIKGAQTHAHTFSWATIANRYIDHMR
jgi:glycosyltransferase involved in cell wall biosynthesis